MSARTIAEIRRATRKRIGTMHGLLDSLPESLRIGSIASELLEEKQPTSSAISDWSAQLAKTARSSPEMWRVAGALRLARRTIDESRTIVAVNTWSRLQREHETLELRCRQLASAALQLTPDVSQEDSDALATRIIQFYRDVGEFERTTTATCAGS